jgi:hypothetical protein
LADFGGGCLNKSQITHDVFMPDNADQQGGHQFSSTPTDANSILS